MKEFTVGGVNYRTDGNVIETQDLNGNWITWNGITAARAGTAAAVRQAAQQAMAQPAAPSNAANPGGKTAAQISLDELAARQGDGWTVVGGPVQKMDSTGLVPIKGQYTVLLSGPGGAQRRATIVPPSGFDPTRDKPEDIVWTGTDIEEVVKPAAAGQSPEEKNAAVAQAQAQTAYYQAQLKQLQQDEAERDKNEKAGNGRLTDKDLATLGNMAAQTGVSQGQLQLAREQMVQNGQIAGGQLGVAQGNLQVAQANQALAERRAGIEADLAAGKLTNDQARLALDQEQQAWNKQIENARLLLQQQTQAAQNQIAQGQLAVSQQQLAQNAAQAQQVAETAARGQTLQAATSAYASERNAQQEAARTGQGLLSARAGTFQNLATEPFQAAAGLSRGSAGKYGMLSGGGVHFPEGTVSGLLQGASGLATAMYGGQSSIDAAIQAIEGIRPGAAMTPMGQAAAAAIRQAIDGARATAGVGNVNAPATANNAPRQTQTTPITAPQTITPMATTPGRTNTAAVPGFSTLGPIAGTPGIGGPNAYSATPFPFPQSGQPEGGGVRRFMAPTTAPQVNLYIGGGG